VGGSPQGGGGGFRTNRRLLAMSALMSASAYFRLLPPRPATSSSIASFTVLLCAALVLEDICAAPLCALPVFTWRTPVGSRQTAFLLLVSGNLIRLEAVNGSAALAADVGAAISPSIVAVAGASTHVSAVLMSGSSSMMMLRDLRLFAGCLIGSAAVSARDLKL
jgi:hypothetical protein